MTEKERYATIGTWEKILNNEGFEVNIETVRRRLSAAGAFGEKGRLRTGHVLLNGFYAESAVRSALADLLQDIPWADEDGFIQKEGETYGSMHGLSELLGIAANSIESRFNPLKPRTIQGRDRSGHVMFFHSLTDVIGLSEDLLKSLPRADRNGLVFIDGETYGTIPGLAKLLGISKKVIRSCTNNSSLNILSGRNRSGVICNFYSASEVRAGCEDHFEDLPLASKDGCLEILGETYGTINAISRLLAIHPNTIRSKIGASSPVTHKGKAVNGRIYIFYRVTDMHNLCVDLITQRQKSDDR